MSAAAPAREPEARRFRRRLLLAMMLVVSVITVVSIVLARRAIAVEEQATQAREFAAALASLRQVQQVRHSLLVERCRALARKPRIHAALEDGALDLLYLSARDELRDVLRERTESPGRTPDHYSLHAFFYRFLDATGKVIPPDAGDNAGELSAAEERQLALPHLPDRPQLGYLAGPSPEAPRAELLAMPIVSIATGEGIAALVLGFPPVPFEPGTPSAALANGVWFGGNLHLDGLPPAARQHLQAQLAERLERAAAGEGEGQFAVAAPEAGDLMVFYQRLNPDSLFPPAYEVSMFSLHEMAARQRRRGWQIFGAGAALVLGGFVASQLLSRRLAEPVERLAHDSAEQRSQRERAEVALQSTSAELKRAARFSADASHQLKTPVAVLRAGLEELLANGHLTPQECDEVAGLIHQTYRLSSIIEDLLLLSRIDAGRLQLQFTPVNLSALVEASLDDLGTLPEGHHLTVDSDLPPDLHIAGEKRYTSLILQNLLENARKYNRPGGRLRLRAEQPDGEVVLRIANTAVRPIPPEARAHIFERFHRGAVAENIPGYGLGLNLARELARIHGGDVRLLRSDEEWTELEVRFRSARPGTPAPPGRPPP